MAPKGKPSTKKPKGDPPKNPTDPNLLARDVLEAFLGEPLTKKPKRKPAKAKKK